MVGFGVSILVNNLWSIKIYLNTDIIIGININNIIAWNIFFIFLKGYKLNHHQKDFSLLISSSISLFILLIDKSKLNLLSLS